MEDPKREVKGQLDSISQSEHMIKTVETWYGLHCFPSVSSLSGTNCLPCQLWRKWKCPTLLEDHFFAEEKQGPAALRSEFLLASP